MSNPTAPWIRSRGLLLGALAVSLATLLQVSLPAPGRGQAVQPLQEGMLAPELDTQADWIGVEKPLRLRELRGKFVLLDFWTFC
jgi:hypothetical protein